MKSYTVTLTFTEPILGTVPKNKEVYAEYIATRAALDDEAIAEEIASVPHVEEKGWTGFHELDGKPFLYDYVIKGFFKDACGMLRRVKGTGSKAIRAYRKIIDGLVFVEPRKIPLLLPEGEGYSLLERPLRAQTAQGERVALARSDTCPPGTVLKFALTILDGVPESTLIEWLDYGAFRGLGQWRNASYGRFTYELEQG